MKEAEWERLYQSLKEKLGEWNLYWQVFDPTKDSEAIRGSLADDVADVYRDVKEGLDCHNPDSTLQGEAIWVWRVGYYSHWGKHAIDALRTIHFLLEDTLSEHDQELRFSPDDLQSLVQTKLLVRCHHWNLLGQRLGDDLPVKGIAMVQGQAK